MLRARARMLLKAELRWLYAHADTAICKKPWDADGGATPQLGCCQHVPLANLGMLQVQAAANLEYSQQLQNELQQLREHMARITTRAPPTPWPCEKGRRATARP